MKRKVIVICLLLHLFNESFAQMKQFSGVVVDANTLEPLPWAHLSLRDRGTGTVTNIEGNFSINISEAVNPVTVVISIIGYKSRLLLLPKEESKELKIYMEPDIRVLNEVVIRPKDLRQLILDATNKIPQNYLDKPSVLTGFYRESLRYDSTSYIYILEGVFQARKESYGEVHNSGQVKLLKARKKEFEDSLQSLNKIRFYAGPHIIHGRDFISNRIDFINERKLMDYDYSIDEVRYLDNQEIYEISFEPNSINGLFYGTLFLNVNSGTFISAKYSLTKAGLSHERSFDKRSSFLNREFLINYMQLENGKMVIQNIWQQGTLQVKGLSKKIIYATEFVTTNVDTTNAVPFTYDERFQHGDFFIDKSNNLDPAFWENFNIIKENNFIQHIQDIEIDIKSKSVDYSPLEINPDKAELTKPMTMYSFDLALTSLFPNYSMSNVLLATNGTNIVSSVAKAPHIALGFYSSFEIHLVKNFRFVLGSASTFGKLGFDNINMGIGYEAITNIKSRPLRIISGLGISYNNLRYPIGIEEGPIAVNKKELSGKVEVLMRKIYYSIQPSIKLSLELTHRWEFFITANLLFDFKINNSILFKETDRLFLTRKSSSLPTNDSSINFTVDGVATEMVPLSISSLFVNTGVTFKYSRADYRKK